MSLSEFESVVRPHIENELKQIVNGIGDDQFIGLRGMLAYHLGWEGEGAGEKAQGKRIRPFLCCYQQQRQVRIGRKPYQPPPLSN